MSHRTQKAKLKKRATKLANLAWDAIEEDDLLLALKLARKATREHPANPLLWNDLGLIAQQNDELGEAEKAFQCALLIAPDYAEAYANLAALSAQKGRLQQAIRLQERAAQLAPNLTSLRERLQQYQLIATQPEEPTPAPAMTQREAPLPAELPTKPGVTGDARYDWERIQDDLQGQGYALLPKLLTPEECLSLTQLYSQREAFEKVVDLNTEGDGEGEYKFFQRPLPGLVEGLRSAFYERLAPIANHWREQLQEKDRYPETHAEYLQLCHKKGQSRTTPILLRYTKGGFNELHQDIWGKLYFPFQLAVTLSARGPEGFTGGEFIVAEESPKRRPQRAMIETGLGDGVLFCSRHRLTQVGGMKALVAVKHGLAVVASGERYALGIPFHEYLGD